jgi:hypothetical protein
MPPESLTQIYRRLRPGLNFFALGRASRTQVPVKVKPEGRIYPNFLLV